MKSINLLNTINSGRKKIAVLTAAVLLMAGAALPYAVHAANSKGDNKPNCTITADKVAETYNLDKATVQQYCQKGTSPKDLYRAAFLAQASGKSLDEVMSKKTASNSWKDVAKALGVTKEQVKAARQQLMANKMHSNLNLDQQAVQNLLKQGYRPNDIAMAGVLAQNTQKQVTDVLALKKINNNWHDVAKLIGVNDATYKADREKVRSALPHSRHHGKSSHNQGNHSGHNAQKQ